MVQITKWSLGIIFLVSVTIIWSFASYLTQYIYADLDFKSPFVLTYISSSFFAIYLPAWQLWIYLGWAKDIPRLRKPECFDKKHQAEKPKITQLEHDNESDGESSGDTPFLQASTPSSSSKNHALNLDQSLSDDSSLKQYLRSIVRPLSKKCSHEDIFYLGILLCPMWFLGNILYNYSLLLTSIASSTIISNTSGVFTLFFSWLCGIEDITVGKLIGLVLCLGGVALVALEDDGNVGSPHSFVGDLYAIVGALMYGLYTTILKLKVEEDESVSMQLVLGYLGLVNVLLLTPFLVVMIFMHWGNLDNFSGTIFGFVVLSAIFDDVIADYLWARSVVLTSPTVATVGLTLTIPLAILTDMLSGNSKAAVTGMSLGGAALVVMGFCLVNVGFAPLVSLLRWYRGGTGEVHSEVPTSEPTHL